MIIILNCHLNYDSKFNGAEEALFNVKTGKIISKKSPITKTSYLDGVKNVLYRIHYGDYGGYPLKIISFNFLFFNHFWSYDLVGGKRQKKYLKKNVVLTDVL